MRELILDVKKMTSPAQAHAYLAQILHFPDYYGANLDALHDCLGDLDEEILIKIPGEIAVGKKLGSFGVHLTKVFQDTAAENKFLKVEIL